MGAPAGAASSWRAGVLHAHPSLTCPLLGLTLPMAELWFLLHSKLVASLLPETSNPYFHAYASVNLPPPTSTNQHPPLFSLNDF